VNVYPADGFTLVCVASSMTYSTGFSTVNSFFSWLNRVNASFNPATILVDLPEDVPPAKTIRPSRTFNDCLYAWTIISGKPNVPISVGTPCVDNNRKSMVYPNKEGKLAIRNS